MTPILIQALTEVLSNEEKLSSIEMEAMSRMHFMGWQGFKRFFKYRSKDRKKHSICLKKWAIDYAETNIPFSVDYNSGNSVMTFENIVSFVYVESEHQLKRLIECMNKAFEEDEIALANKINCLIEDQAEECKYLKRIIDEWNNSKQLGDNSWISRKDHLLHKKYKKVEKRLYNK
jgi:ferritin